MSLFGLSNKIALVTGARRIGEPDDVAAAVILLASDAGGYISGITLPVDGGKTTLSEPKRGPSATDATMDGATFN